MSLSIGILNTFPPAPCGLATFAESLAGALTAGGDACGLVDPTPEALSGYDVVVAQHRDGVTGIEGVLDAVVAPLVVIAHTVAAGPSSGQRESLERIARRADVMVAMTATARRRLIDVYRVPSARIAVIPHGAVTADPVEPRRIGPPRILTWGLIGPGKGIELAIDALSALRRLKPAPRYEVVGPTDPRVLAEQGEAYRTELLRYAGVRGVAHLLTFRPTYLDVAALKRAVAEADVIVLPYEPRDQVTSAVLVEAVAARRPVVATAFPHAVELLAGGAGVVVPHGAPRAMADAITRVLTEPEVAAAMCAAAGPLAADLRWSAVAGRYRELAAALVPSSAAIVAG